jgi:GDPmannose 4,6-dehydratase
MLQQPEPDEFIIATGEAHTVREWCERAFARLGLDYLQFVRSDPALWQPAEPVPLVGNSAKAQEVLSWSPSVPFAELVYLLVDADLAAEIPPLDKG